MLGGVFFVKLISSWISLNYSLYKYVWSIHEIDFMQYITRSMELFGKDFENIYSSSLWIIMSLNMMLINKAWKIRKTRRKEYLTYDI